MPGDVISKLQAASLEVGDHIDPLKSLISAARTKNYNNIKFVYVSYDSFSTFHSARTLDLSPVEVKDFLYLLTFNRDFLGLIKQSRIEVVRDLPGFNLYSRYYGELVKITFPQSTPTNNDPSPRANLSVVC